MPYRIRESRSGELIAEMFSLYRRRTVFGLRWLRDALAISWFSSKTETRSPFPHNSPSASNSSGFSCGEKAAAEASLESFDLSSDRPIA